MKTVLIIFAMTLAATTSFAWTENSPTQKEYTFKFKMKDGSFEYSRKAPTYEEAYEAAAQACFKHFKGGRHISEDQGLDIIDVCANPRKS